MTANPTGEIDVVFSQAIIGAMAHPGRENRRRALLAFEILLRHHLEAMTQALATTLSALDEPTLLSWLLKVVTNLDMAQAAVADLCHDPLLHHANGPHLTVRALA